MERCRIVAGDLHINPAERPLLQCWRDSPRLLVIAMEQRFIEQVVSDAFDGSGSALRTAIGIRDRSSRAWLRRVVDYIDAHLAEGISLRDLTALVGLSSHHFGESFKVSTGMPAHRYVIERRIR